MPNFFPFHCGLAGGHTQSFFFLYLIFNKRETYSFKIQICVTDYLGKQREKERQRGRWECLLKGPQAGRNAQGYYIWAEEQEWKRRTSHWGDKQGPDYAGDLEINHKSHQEV